ncbi:MAG: outer membrane protein assembly factor BamA [Candidatus Hydrogenedentes bacterium]|nr:outer membrane protein assembly factor BamA [Candidatus Hydrogenedentota bacterium]
MKTFALGVFLTLIALAPSVLGQPTADQQITLVNIEGLERISDQVVRSKLEVQPGQNYNPRAIARDIRRLYSLNYFSNIQADATPEGAGLAITYALTEKQVVAEVRIVGAQKLKERRIRGAVSFREGGAFVPEAYEGERDAILELYQTKGFANTSVDIVTEKVGPSRVRVIYNINEGKKAKIRKIAFVGNDAMKNRELHKAMKTKKARWFIGGKYEAEKLEADLANILDQYGNKGRLEADIPRTDITYNDTGKRMDVVIHIEEGAEYTVKDLQVADNVVFDDDELESIVKVHAGDVHNKGQVNKDADSVEKGYQDSGYVNAQVAPQVVLDRDDKTTTVVHDIEEGDLKYIKEITITGNGTTKDEVIRRNLLLEPGQRFDGTALETSKRGILRTRYFNADSLRVNLIDDEENDLYTNMMIDVEEMDDVRTFNFGAGYNSEEGVGGFIELNYRNFDATNPPWFIGGGQEFQTRLNVGDQRNEFSISFNDPEFLGYPVAFGADIFSESLELSGAADYTQEQRGFQFRFGKVLSPYVTVRSAWRFEETDLTELPIFVNPEIRQQRGQNTTISSNWTIERNTLNNYLDPTGGAEHTGRLQIAGYGGDNQFIKLEHDSVWYFPLSEEGKWTFSVRTREGFVSEYGSSDFVPLQDRMYAGGTTSVRGYENRDIGPKVKQYILFGDDFPIGGDLRWVTNLEIKYKVNDLIRLYGFMDSGGVWRDFGDVNPGDMKHSVGLGMGFDVPRLGPIRLDYGFPLNPDEEQGSGRLHLITGLRLR